LKCRRSSEGCYSDDEKYYGPGSRGTAATRDLHLLVAMEMKVLLPRRRGSAASWTCGGRWRWWEGAGHRQA
jgi:hypothetical protein